MGTLSIPNEVNELTKQRFSFEPVEGVNIGVQDQMTLHTSPGCTVKVGTQGQSGMSFPSILTALTASTKDSTNPPPLSKVPAQAIPTAATAVATTAALSSTVRPSPAVQSSPFRQTESTTSDVGTSYGTAFNSVGGGVYATLWNASVIEIWYWARNQVPADVTAGTPNPANWGSPAADFSGCVLFPSNQSTFQG